MSSELVRLGRKRALPSCPNPLFLEWLTELRDQAAEKGLKTQYVYQKALSSLKKYPLPLNNGKEAKILQNFGDGICKILDDRLEKYYRVNGPDAPIHSLPSGVQASGHCSTNLDPSKASSNTQELPGTSGGDHKKTQKGEVRREKGARKKRGYVPQKRSGGHAVLLTLYRHSQVPDSKGFMFKNELQTESQPLCDKSFTVPDLGSKYTAWASVGTLIQRDLVLKTHNPARYSLTELGLVVAEQLESGEREEKNDQKVEEEKREGGEAVECPDTVDLTLDDDDHDDEGVSGRLAKRPSPVGPTEESPTEESQAVEHGEAAARGILLPGCYEIILCVDFIETTGGNTAGKPDLVTELQKNGVTFDIRKLNVGDFLWVAREQVAPDPGQLRPPTVRELVLDYIIERKRMDDLCGSIIDGRFREQKFRLKRCGLHKPIYLVEEHGSAAAHLSLPESTLQQAIANTQVVDGFFVKRVQDVKESAAYLTIMTRYLQKLYTNRTLHCRSRELEGDGPRGAQVSCSLMSFTEFNHGAVKSKCQTVREVFARQLMQISGLSGDKAAAILEHYNTVNSLVRAYGQCASEAQKEKLLSSIRYGKLKRNLGPALSRTVYQLYCTKGPLS
ncbi:crossover junction endonuclease MUS81 isoform X1 [Clupea harengus]|uniref:Crossover junction endonuclease MUS81 n=1 Tax=Clupea harengus TaxID=7950 RepID=A0A6P8GQL5_CLUHA|nr:crossover junction endonuclease MUS81 isoform X1 [Clupea harengus]XP_031441013.1 crossover junction endonuclease MUS81 isoform X1 [Clupea harengus]